MSVKSFGTRDKAQPSRASPSTAAIILANAGRYDGPTPPLTGSRALDMADMAALASELLGRPIRREVLSEEGLRAKMAARGVPDGAMTIALGLYRASRAGEFATVDPALERLLARPPIRLRELLARKVGG